MVSNFINAFIYGFTIGISLIVAIGAQNAFILKQGLLGKYVFILCFTCACLDSILIFLGVFGLNAVIKSTHWIFIYIQYLGILFLLIYGIKNLINAFISTSNLNINEENHKDLKSAWLTCLAFTLLNPHVYLDTIVLIGTISTKFSTYKLAFALGASIASFIFFFGLGYGAKSLKPVFTTVKAWRILDALIGIIMLGIAINIVFML